LVQVGKATYAFASWKHGVVFLYDWIMCRCCLREKTGKYWTAIGAKLKPVEPVVNWKWEF